MIKFLICDFKQTKQFQPSMKIFSAFLVSLSVIYLVKAVTLEEFYNFGKGYDSELPRNDDAFEGPINLNHKIKYYGKYQSKIYVVNNGLVAFNRGDAPYNPQKFPLNGSVFFSDANIKCFHPHISEHLRNRVFLLTFSKVFSMKNLNNLIS